MKDNSWLDTLTAYRNSLIELRDGALNVLLDSEVSEDSKVYTQGYLSAVKDSIELLAGYFS